MIRFTNFKREKALEPTYTRHTGLLYYIMLVGERENMCIWCMCERWFGCLLEELKEGRFLMVPMGIFWMLMEKFDIKIY